MFFNEQSAYLHSETELPGVMFNRDTLEIIRFRYDFAANYIEDKDVLEVGCGAGLGLNYLGSRAATFIGGEYAEENLKLCQKLYGAKFRLVRMDAHHIPFGDCCFDVVVALAMIYYLRIDEFLLEARRVLRPGGVLLFCTSNKNVSGFVPAPHTTKYYSVPELSHFLRESGFEPTFFGAFKAAGGSLLASRVRGAVKFTAKIMLHTVRGGALIWQRVRQKALGETFRLPTDVLSIQPSVEQLIPLDKNHQDFIHRVIYSASQKID